MGFGVDEAHVLSSWGEDFRKAFHQIGFIKHRLPDGVTLIAVSATIRIGKPLESICALLGLEPGRFHFIHRSNIRYDVQILFRELYSGLFAFSFPELE